MTEIYNYSDVGGIFNGLPLDRLQKVFLKALRHVDRNERCSLVSEWNAGIKYCNEVLTFKNDN